MRENSTLYFSYIRRTLKNTGGDSAEVKRSKREADYGPPSSAEVKNDGAIFPLPHLSSWHSA
jgi:hypothetical protein